MNAFLSVLEKYEIERNALKRGQLTTLQVNMGNLCNQSCAHCHIEASPQGKDIMPKEIVDDILSFLSRHKIKTLDITGGAPELNPNFDYLVTQARSLVEDLIVRSNLTILFEKGKVYLPEFFKANRVHLVCSMPCYRKENVDRQRGAGVFEKSIKALKLLNAAGFSKIKDLQLDLVYNPLGAYLPASQDALEKDYRKVLNENYGIEFDRLLTITNVAIKRFKIYLESNNEYEKYSHVLETNFNPDTLKTLMCRTFLSVGYDGRLYDCDFNLALGYALRDLKANYLTIKTLNARELENNEIITGEHCLACTAGSGSSCQGALTSDNTRAISSKEDAKETVKAYYGKILQNKKDLKTNACCSVDGSTSFTINPEHSRRIDSFPQALKSLMKQIEPEILDKFYGCGSPIPPLLKNCTVLDLGCGTGRDVYLVSALVGEDGMSIGVDMTDEQLEVAQRYKDAQMQRFGFKKYNVNFKKGYIEDLRELGIADSSVDVVISNCVINLSPDKRSVFSEIFRVLKTGGELYFSDVFADRRIPQHIKNDPIFYGECMGGSMYIEDFRRMLRDIGCLDYRVMSKRKITIDDSDMAFTAEGITFYSMAIRAFKIDDLEDTCEDYGQIAVYLGTIPETPHQFILDERHIFIKDKPVVICGNTASILQKSRYSRHFKIIGDKKVHFGLFNCKIPDGVMKRDESKDGSCC